MFLKEGTEQNEDEENDAVVQKKSGIDKEY